MTIYDEFSNIKGASKRWRLRHPEEYKIMSKNRQEKALKQERNRRKTLRLRVLVLLGNYCTNPYNLNHGDFLGDTRCLQIDHINGGGAKEINSIGTSKRYRKILKNPKGYQLLCANCNWIKRHICGEIGGINNKYSKVNLEK